MRIDICGLNFRLTDAIARHIDRRVQASLGWASDRIGGVAVRVGDINGLRGGIDKSCRIVAWLADRRRVIAEATHRDLYVAIDHTAARIRTAVARQLGRRRSLHRHYARQCQQALA